MFVFNYRTTDRQSTWYRVLRSLDLQKVSWTETYSNKMETKTKYLTRNKA